MTQLELPLEQAFRVRICEHVRCIFDVTVNASSLEEAIERAEKERTKCWGWTGFFEIVDDVNFDVYDNRDNLVLSKTV